MQLPALQSGAFIDVAENPPRSHPRPHLVAHQAKSKHPPEAVWMGWVLIGYEVSLWTHTRTPPACKYYRFPTRAAGAVGRMMRRSGSLRKAMAMA